MDTESTATLKIAGIETESNTVPVNILVRLLEGLQQLSLLFAASVEQKPLHQRFKPTDDLRRRYRLRCGVPIPGSYVVPLELADDGEEHLFHDQTVLPMVFDFIDAVSGAEEQKARDILPDSRYRERALHSLRSFVPRKGERWTASLGVGSEKTVSLNGKLSQHVDRMLQQGIEESATMTVIGEVIGVDFEDYKLSIRRLSDRRELDCSYQPELEANLLESRRDLVQVTGEFTLDREGYPVRLTNVNQIEVVDLSPMTFSVIEFDGRVLFADPALNFDPKLDDDSKQLYVVEDLELDLCVFANTRDELVNELMQHIIFVWDEYAQALPHELTASAQLLRETYLARFRENGNAKE